MKLNSFINTINLIISCSYIYGWCVNSNIILRLLKPIPVFLMMIQVYWSKLLTYAFLTAMIGDIMLMSDELILFLLGMISFGLTHLLLLKFMNVSQFTIGFINKLIIPIIILLMLIGQYYQIPIILSLSMSCYGSLLLLTMIISWYTDKKIFQGMLCFVISDTLLAIDQFFIKVSYSCIYIITLYWTAMYLISKTTYSKPEIKNKE